MVVEKGTTQPAHARGLASAPFNGLQVDMFARLRSPVMRSVRADFYEEAGIAMTFFENHRAKPKAVRLLVPGFPNVQAKTGQTIDSTSLIGLRATNVTELRFRPGGRSRRCSSTNSNRVSFRRFLIKILRC